MSKRTLEELNLLDDFMFGSVVTYPGIGEAFSRKLLRFIFQREFGKLNVVPQKVYYGSDTDKHGTRLDVYLEEELVESVLTEDVSSGEVEKVTSATIYDVEPDQNDGESSKTALPKRVRFYHAKIDGRGLQSGENYRLLKNVIIIMIMPYDPFGLDRMVYTIQNGCVEEPSMPYDDGAKTLFFYTQGEKGIPSEELRQFLYYMEHTTAENAVTDELKAVHQMVETVKHDEEVSVEYMKIYEREERLTTKAKAEGRAEGRTEGKAEAVLELLEDYGTIPEQLTEKVMSQQDLEILKRWHKLAAKVESVEEFQEKMQ